MPNEIIKKIPTAFISYSWDSEEHREWVKRLGARIRDDSIDLVLDEWKLAPGDQLPRFMETAIRESDFVLIVCTPAYKRKSDGRLGGVGYEGNVITGELLTDGNDRKFVPLLRAGEWREAAPSWLRGKLYIDLRGEAYSEDNYRQLLNALRGILPEPPPLGASILGPPHNIDMVGVTHQKVYADFRNAAIRVFQAAKTRTIIRNQEGPQDLLSRTEDDLKAQVQRAFELSQEIDLFASEPVGKAAREVAGLVVAFQMTSAAPGFEGKLDELYLQLIKEAMPTFREEVRRELDARAGAANPGLAADA